MYYVYLIVSIKDPVIKYVGLTENLTQRLATHNSGGSLFTRPFRPWKLVTFLGFDTQEKAKSFERYLKTGSGSAFAKKRFW